MNAGYKVIGLENKKGVFNEKPYDNVILHCIREKAEMTGQAVDHIKMRRGLYNIFPAQPGDVVQPLYSSTGVLEGLMTLPAWPK